MRGVFRRTPALWLLPALALFLTTATVLSPSAGWVGWWQRTAVAIHVGASIVLGTSSAALSAWLVATHRRDHSFAEASAPRSGAVVVARVVAPVWAIGALCFGAMQLLAYIRTALVAPGRPVISLALLTCGVLAAVCGLGALVGAWTPRLVAAPLAATLALVWMASPVYSAGGEEGWGRLLPVIQQPGWDPALKAADSRILRVVVWQFTLVVVLVLVAGAQRRWTAVRPRWIAVSLVTAGVSAALALAPQVADARAFVDQRTLSDAHVCRLVTGGEVCVWADQADLLAVYGEALGRLAAAAADTDVRPRALVEAGLQEYFPDAWSVTVMSRHPSVADIVTEQLGRYVPPTPRGCDRYEEPALSGAAWQDVILGVVSRQAGVPVPDYYALAPAHVVDRLLSMSEGNRRAFIRSATEAVQACRPVPELP